MPSRTRISNQHFTVDVSALGAEMQAITAADGREFLWNGDAAFWAGRSPILFPIVGKAPEDTVEIARKAYPMAQHGIARRREFALAASSPTMCRYELAASEDTMAVYPFDFVLAVEHALEERSLTVTAEVTNWSETAMPFGLGFHPAFVWPLPGARKNAEHTITLDNRAEPEQSRLAGGLIDTAKLRSPFAAGRLVLERDMFVNDAMVFAEGAGSGLVYGAEGGPALRFTFENLPNLALWNKPGAPFLCIEPWHGTAALNGGSRELADRPYTTELAAGGKARFAFTVELPV